MDKISLRKAGKRYKKDWIFKDMDFEFLKGKSYVILGPNGSGKSTLLKMVASYLGPTKGEIQFLNQEEEIPLDKVQQYITMATPYMELPEEFTPDEILDFHLGFKQFYGGMSKEEFLDLIYLTDAKEKAVSMFSSGMKQRLKLGLAIASESDLLLLDEPTINLDQKGVDLYRHLMDKYGHNRIIVVCSNNIKEEYDFCDVSINVMDYKK